MPLVNLSPTARIGVRVNGRKEYYMNQRLLMAAVAVISVAAHAHVVWQIGQQDGTGNEFALARTTPPAPTSTCRRSFSTENLRTPSSSTPAKC